MSAHQLIVGGQRSGKSRHAEQLGLAWLEAGAGRSVTLLATALALDEEMRARIRHHRDRRPPAFATHEEPLALCAALATLDAPQRLIVVDCLTLWLTNWLMPANAQPDSAGWQSECAALLQLLPKLRSPVVFVSNEIGWGLSPLSRELRDFVDELGRLNQAVAGCCDQLTLMVAGQAWSRPVQEKRS